MSACDGSRDGPAYGCRSAETGVGHVCRAHPFCPSPWPVLNPRPEQKKLELIIGDFVKADLPYFDVCISNTPYQVSLASARLNGFQ